MKSLIIIVSLCLAANRVNSCDPTATTASGTHAPATICSGDLIFQDNFDSLDLARWKHEISLAGGGNWEVLAEWFGCDRQGTPDNIINPIRSARVDTRNSFSFRFGIVEIRARMPAGDWLWLALWMVPTHSVYGGWPTSGEIDILEQRSNRLLFYGAANVGVNQAGSTMNGWPTAHGTRNQVPGFNANFHVYRLEWRPTEIQFLVDGNVMLNVIPGAGFWARGGFAGSGLPNPWINGTIMAPFDQEFFIIMNLAVGGVNFFADHFVNQNSPKPWLNTSPRAAADFWLGRGGWQPTWMLHNSTECHMLIDYVRVWAL